MSTHAIFKGMMKSPHSILETFGKRCREIRDLRGLTQEQVADGTGIKQGTLSVWENGLQWPQLENVEQLAKFYKMPEVYFFSDKNVVFTSELSPSLRKSLEIAWKAIGSVLYGDKVKKMKTP